MIRFDMTFSMLASPSRLSSSLAEATEAIRRVPPSTQCSSQSKLLRGGGLLPSVFHQGSAM